MTNSLIEVFSINVDKLSCLIFSSIRKLAESVRVAIKETRARIIWKVFSWPFCASIKLWGLLLAKTESEKITDLISPQFLFVWNSAVSNYKLLRSILSTNGSYRSWNYGKETSIHSSQPHLGTHAQNHLLKACRRCCQNHRCCCISFMIKASTSDQANSSYREALFEDCHTLLMKYIGIPLQLGLVSQKLVSIVRIFLSTAMADCPHKNSKVPLPSRRISCKLWSIILWKPVFLASFHRIHTIRLMSKKISFLSISRLMLPPLILCKT